MNTARYVAGNVPYWQWMREEAQRRAGYRCERCGKPEAECGKNGLHVHHKIPQTKGGEHSLSNLEALCPGCHSRLHAEARHEAREARAAEVAQ